MSIEVVITCDSGGCYAHSNTFETAKGAYSYEWLVNSWCRYDLRLGDTEKPLWKDMCPKCAAETFFWWIYIVFQGGENFGSAYAIRPHEDGYMAWLQDYDPTKHSYKAGRNVASKYGCGPTPQEDRRINIMPAFIFDKEQ